MADDSGIDPRYAAQFQRGFDPARHPEAPIAAPPPRDPAAPVRLPGGPVTHAERVPDRPLPPPPGIVPPPIGPEVEATPPGDVADEAEPARRLLRWDLVLLVGGAVLVLLALATWWQIAGDLSGFIGTVVDPGEMLMRQVRAMVAQPFFLAGAIAIVAAVVLRALRRSS